jgi:hypothetical protein
MFRNFSRSDSWIRHAITDTEPVNQLRQLRSGRLSLKLENRWLDYATREYLAELGSLF